MARDARTNARIIERILDAEPGPARDVVLLNAGAALFIAGEAKSIQEGIERASRAVDEGAARQTLDQLVELSKTEQVLPGAAV